MTAVALVVLAFPPLDLAALSPADVIRFHGLPVLAAVTIVNQPAALDGTFYVGDDTHPDGFARVAYLRDGGDIRQGDRVAVVGRLRVIVHPARVIDGTPFRATAEVRVDA